MITCQAIFRDVKRTNSTLKWSVDDPKEMEGRLPRLKLREVRYHSTLDRLSQSRPSARIVLTLLESVSNGIAKSFFPFPKNAA